MTRDTARGGKQSRRAAAELPSLNVLVLGMHRSGTSAVAEALRAAGLYAGPEAVLMKPEPQNPSGFGERLDVALFNDRLLASLGWFWDAPEAQPLAEPPERRQFVAEGRQLISQSAGATQPLVLKDPRISLLLPWWRQILLDRFVPVVVLRSPEEVAWSLTVLDGHTRELGLALWATYHRHLAAGLDGLSWVTVDYERLCDAPAPAFSALADALESLGVRAKLDRRAGAAEVHSVLRRATQPSDSTAGPEGKRLAKLLRSWLDATVAVRDSFDPPPDAPSDWEMALLREHRRTREGAAREAGMGVEIEQLRQREMSLESALAEATAQRDEANRRLSVALADAESEAGPLAERVSDLEGRLAEAVADRERLAHEAKDLTAQFDLQGATLREAESEVATLRSRAGELEDHLAEVATDRIRLAIEAANLRAGRSSQQPDPTEDGPIGDLRLAPDAPTFQETPRSRQSAVRRMGSATRRIYARAVLRLPVRVHARLWHNPLFDATWYSASNVDVAEAHIQPELHYRLHGVGESRNPNSVFDAGWYLRANPDVASKGLNPLDHYLLYGAAEGRAPSPVFDADWYQATNPDVAASGQNPFLHYLRHGIGEGRAPMPSGARRAISTPIKPSTGDVQPPEVASITPSRQDDLPSPPIGHDAVRLIALYESAYYFDGLVGDGAAETSDWLRVAKRRPSMPDQQRLPGELGYYDLLVEDVRNRQAELARAYGVHAFCYRAAWGNRGLRNQPFREMLRTNQPEFPFTVRLTLDTGHERSGAIRHVSLDWLHNHQPELRSLLEALLDHRSVMVGDRPMLVLEGLDRSDGAAVTDLIRELALGVGLPGIYLVGAAPASQNADETEFGVNVVLDTHPDLALLAAGSRGEDNRAPHVVPFATYVRRAVANEERVRYQTVLSGWDQAPQNGFPGLVLTGPSPDAYGAWLDKAVDAVRTTFPADRQFVFISSWNDWRHASNLEPDGVLGRAYLERTRSSVVR